jgi:hypothetical protein
VHDEEEVFRAISDHWQPAFAAKSVHELDAKVFIDHWSRRLPDIE